MKQLTLTGRSAFVVPSDRVPTSADVCAGARPSIGRSDRTRPSVVEHGIVERMTYATTCSFASLHGATGRVAIPSNARRRPQETPT